MASQLECNPEEILPASTGVIGIDFPSEKIERVLSECRGSLSSSVDDFSKAAEAMMTTDTFPKWASAELIIEGKAIRLLGLAKGAGMIHPNMATMLAFIVTDAEVESQHLREALTAAVGISFHCLTVDGDTSTNDTVLMFSNGASGNTGLSPDNSEWDVFRLALEEICKSLARQIASDGEGASHLVEITVRGASQREDARQVAMTIAQSLLVKTAICGNDPNWGRIVAAIGRSGITVHPESLSVSLGGSLLFSHGLPQTFDPGLVSNYLANNSVVSITVDLQEGNKEITVWTCDLTKDYVHINANYTT
jgi:glutamate N-acetyltransferase/amino-acid N-acetyltransferase